jgi:hypothetical protein
VFREAYSTRNFCSLQIIQIIAAGNRWRPGSGSTPSSVATKMRALSLYLVAPGGDLGLSELQYVGVRRVTGGDFEQASVPKFERMSLFTVIGIVVVTRCHAPRIP